MRSRRQPCCGGPGLFDRPRGGMFITDPARLQHETSKLKSAPSPSARARLGCLRLASTTRFIGIIAGVAGWAHARSRGTRGQPSTAWENRCARSNCRFGNDLRAFGSWEATRRGRLSGLVGSDSQTALRGVTTQACSRFRRCPSLPAAIPTRGFCKPASWRLIRRLNAAQPSGTLTCRWCLPGAALCSSSRLAVFECAGRAERTGSADQRYFRLPHPAPEQCERTIHLGRHGLQVRVRG